jgi:hypothetical protein
MVLISGCRSHAFSTAFCVLFLYRTVILKSHHQSLFISIIFQKYLTVGFEVLTAVSTKMAVFLIFYRFIFSSFSFFFGLYEQNIGPIKDPNHKTH